MQLNEYIIGEPVIKCNAWNLLNPSFELEIAFALVHLEIRKPRFLICLRQQSLLVLKRDPVMGALTLRRQIVKAYLV